MGIKGCPVLLILMTKMKTKRMKTIGQVVVSMALSCNLQKMTLNGWKSDQKPRVRDIRFFFGNDSYTWNEEGYAQDKIQENYYYKQMDLQFIENAKEAIKKKYRVYYNCSW